MVLAIMRPGLQAHLLDKNVKKIVFLKHVAHELKLAGLTFHARDFTDLLKGRSELFDLVVSRALSCEPRFIDYLIPCVTRNGFLVLMTGPSRQPAVISPYMREVDRWDGILPFTGAARTVSLWQKLS
jgi:16S rRNA G527 N7-methylase RsmG